MKNLKKLMVVALLMLAGVSGKIAAYTYTVKNDSRKDIKVKLYYALGTLQGWSLIKARKSRTFSWKFPNPKFGLCLTEIKVSYISPWKVERARFGETAWPHPTLRVNWCKSVKMSLKYWEGRYGGWHVYKK